MPTKQTIRQNISWLIGVNLLSKPIWFFFLLVSARLLGPSEFGKYMLSMGFVSVVFGIFEGGIDIHTIRSLSPDLAKFRTFFPHTVLLKITSGILASVTAYAIGYLVPSLLPDITLFIAIALYALANTLLTHFRFVFRSFEIMQYEAISIAFEKILVVVLCGFTLFVAPFALQYGIVFSIAYCITCILTLFLVIKKIGYPGIPKNWDRLIPDIIKPALPFATMNIFIILYLRSGTIMLTVLTGNDQLVGYFNAGYRIVEAFVLFPSTIIAPLYPVFARRIKDKNEVGRLATDAIRIILGIAVIIATPVFLFHDQITVLMFGVQYQDASRAVGIICLAMIPIGLNWVVGTLVAISGRQSKANYFIFVISLGNILLLLFLIPVLSVEGAAISTLVTECAIVSANWYLVQDYIGLKKTMGIIIKIGIPSICAFLLFLILPDTALSFKILLLLGMLSVGYYLFKVISFKDLSDAFREKIS